MSHIEQPEAGRAHTHPSPAGRRRGDHRGGIAGAGRLRCRASPPAPRRTPTGTGRWSSRPRAPRCFCSGRAAASIAPTTAARTWSPAGLANINATSLAQAGGTIYAGGVSKPAHASAIVTKKGTYLVTPGQGVLATSSDGGKTWQDLHPSGLPNLEIAALAVDPAKTGDLYAVLRNGSVHLSTDGGHSFTLVTARIAGTPWALALTKDSHLVAGDMSNGNYLSTTGKQWQHIPFTDSSGSHMVMEYAVDPADPTHVLMTSYGIVGSTDSGKSWHIALHSKVMFGPIAFGSGNSGVAYAVGFNGSVWKSS